MAAGKIDALSQFALHPMFGDLGRMGFSQSPLMMIVAAALTLLILGVGMAPRAMVPGPGVADPGSAARWRDAGG